MVSYITDPLATWISLMLLLSVHLFTNYLAVRSVSMKTLNRQRANIVFGNFLVSQTAYTPEHTAHLESVFEWNGVIRLRNCIVGSCVIGVSLGDVLCCLEDTTITELLDVFEDEQYILWYNMRTKKALVVLKIGSNTRSQLKAWLHALLVCTILHKDPLEDRSLLDSVALGLTASRTVWNVLEPALLKSGWDLELGALEVRSGVRVEVAKENKKSI